MKVNFIIIKKMLFYLFIIQEPIPVNVGSACINAKERETRRGKKRKGIEAHRVRHRTTSQATDALTGDEEQNGKQENKKKETGSGSPTQLAWTIQSPPTVEVTGWWIGSGDCIIWSLRLVLCLKIGDLL